MYIKNNSNWKKWKTQNPWTWMSNAHMSHTHPPKVQQQPIVNSRTFNCLCLTPKWRYDWAKKVWQTKTQMRKMKKSHVCLLFVEWSRSLVLGWTLDAFLYWFWVWLLCFQLAESGHSFSLNFSYHYFKLNWF